MPDVGDRAGRRLTPRERQVLEQAAVGLSNRQIGEALEIAEQTVKNHLSSAMHKLAINDRTHAVVIAIGEGLIGMPRRQRQADALDAAAEAIPLIALTGDDDASTSNTGSGAGMYLATAEGTYTWLAVYSGDLNNNAATSDCVEEFTIDNDTTPTPTP